MTSHEKFLTVAQFAELTHRKVASIYSDFLRNPSSLPPFLKIKGTRRILFPATQTFEWLNGFLVNKSPTPPSTAPISPPRRGRPTKEEQRKAAQLGLTVTQMHKGGEK